MVGYDGTKMFLNLCPNISTIEQSVEEMSNVAIEVLLKMLNGDHEDVEREYVLPVHFVGKR